MIDQLSRRRLFVGAGGLVLSGCDRIAASPKMRKLLKLGEDATFAAQRLVSDRAALAPEFEFADMSPVFRVNGSTNPATPEYEAYVASGFADWRLLVDGLVARPLSLSLAQLRATPHRMQITRHDCVEGWSAIGQWIGTPLRLILRQAGIRSSARYVVFHCADLSGGRPYYESIDMIDAMHPQTILAWAMNGHLLSVPHGAPLRLRVERQLGYKHAKYVMRVEAVASLVHLYGGKAATGKMSPATSGTPASEFHRD